MYGYGIEQKLDKVQEFTPEFIVKRIKKDTTG